MPRPAYGALVVKVVRFERRGSLVVHGGDLYGRPDAVDFIARAGEPTIDWLAEVVVEIARWGTRAGVTTLLERAEDRWQLVASAMPYDALYILRRTGVRIVFSEYVRLQPGQQYRLYLAGAEVVSPYLQVTAQARPATPLSTRRGWRSTRRAS